MKQSFEKGFVTPHPVFVIATYDENDKVYSVSYNTFQLLQYPIPKFGNRGFSIFDR